MNDERNRPLLKRLIGMYSFRRRAQFAGVFLFTLVGAIAELVGIGAVIPFLELIAAPAAMAHKPIVQEVMLLMGSQRVADLIIPAAILLVVAAAISAATRGLLSWISFRYIAGLAHDLAMMVFSRTLRQPYGVYVKRNTAEVLSGLNKVDYVAGYVLSPLMQALSSAVIALGIIVLLIAVDPIPAMIAAATMGLLYLVLGLMSRPALMRIGRRLAAVGTIKVKLTQESMGGIRDIILDQSHAAFEWQFRLVDVEGRKLNAQSAFISTIPRFVIEGMSIVLIAVLAVYYTGRPGGVVGAIPTLGALALGAQRLLPLLQNINVAWSQYAATIGLLADVFELLDAPILKSLPLPEGASIVQFNRKIELRDLSFAFSKEVCALADVNLVIPKGARVGFIGRTGSGKSTLLDIVMGLLEPTAGAILIDDVPLGEGNMRNWQAQIAHVPQSIFLSDTSIAANIAFGCPAESIDMERVRNAAIRADLHDFIETLAESYATNVGERGIRLSGGQRQRIGIARALYKKATVLILDEATSALDDVTEAAVMAGIERLDRNLTVLLIAHRLSTVALCDTVIRLEAGRIIERGTYAGVIA